MTNNKELPKLDQELLEAVEEIVADHGGEERDVNSLYSFSNLLATSGPVADETFRRQLEGRLVSRLVETRQEVHKVSVEQKSSGLLGWLFPIRLRLQLALSALVLVALLTTLLLIPDTREALASFFGFRIEETGNLAQPVVNVARGDFPGTDAGLEATDGLPEMEAGYEVQIVEIPDSRWTLHQQQQAAGFRIPRPGEAILLEGDRILPVPAALPEGFVWQGVVNSSVVHERGIASFGGTSSGGGGTSPLPAFDRSFAVYLVGGDPADRLLLLAQFVPTTLDQLAVRTFHITAPSRTPPVGPEAQQAEAQQADTASGVVATPTRVPAFYEAKTQVGYIVQLGAEEQEELIIVAQGAQEIAFNGTTGFWYDGTWAPDGSWIENSDTVTLTWKQDGYVYQLTGQGLSLDELIQVASSIG